MVIKTSKITFIGLDYELRRGINGVIDNNHMCKGRFTVCSNIGSRWQQSKNQGFASLALYDGYHWQAEFFDKRPLMWLVLLHWLGFNTNHMSKLLESRYRSIVLCCKVYYFTLNGHLIKYHNLIKPMFVLYDTRFWGCRQSCVHTLA